MNQTHAKPTDGASPAKVPGLPLVSPGLQVSSSTLQFDRTEPGNESFLTLKVTPPQPNVPVVLSVSDPALFQLAVGVERLAFKESLTFKPDPQGTYVHLRYTPPRAGKHQSALVIESPTTSETHTVSLFGRTSGMALPVGSLRPVGEASQSAGSTTKAFVAIGLVLGLGIGVYAYRCQIWPDTCGPASALSPPVTDAEETVSESPAEKEPTSTPVVPKPSVATMPVRPRPTQPETQRTQTAAPSQSVNTAERTQAVASAPTRNIPTETPSASAKTTPKPTTAPRPTAVQRPQSATVAPAAVKPVPKPSVSEESELERVLNQNGN
jgi:hypothetical protein